MDYQDGNFTVPAAAHHSQQITFVKANGEYLHLGLFEKTDATPGKLTSGYVQGMNAYPVARTEAQQDGMINFDFDLAHASGVKFKKWLMQGGDIRTQINIEVMIPDEEGFLNTHTYLGWQFTEAKVSSTRGGEPLALNFTGTALKYTLNGETLIKKGVPPGTSIYVKASISVAR